MATVGLEALQKPGEGMRVAPEYIDDLLPGRLVEFPPGDLGDYLVAQCAPAERRMDDAKDPSRQKQLCIYNPHDIRPHNRTIPARISAGGVPTRRPMLSGIVASGGQAESTGARQFQIRVGIEQQRRYEGNEWLSGTQYRQLADIGTAQRFSIVVMMVNTKKGQGLALRRCWLVCGV